MASDRRGFPSPMKLRKAESKVAVVNELHRRVSDLETAVATKSEEVAGLNVHNAELPGKIADLNYDMDTELYPHLLTAMARGGKAISMSINRGIQEGLEAGIKHGKDDRSLAEVEAYDSGLELTLKDSPLELLMSSQTLEGDHCDEDPTPEFSAFHDRAEKRKVDTSSSLAVSETSIVVPFVSFQETSLVVADYKISSVAIVDDTVPFSEPHDDLFDTTVLDKPVDL
ncbi:hypothetical protein Tco_0798932 [Tanacetum coccineum]